MKKFNPIIENSYFDDNDHVSYMTEKMRELFEITKGEINIIMISFFDKYQGAFAIILLNNKQYKIWNTEHDLFWIDNYPIDNTSDENNNPGFKGDLFEIANLVKN